MRIYPILEFRDKVVKAINKTIAKIPGLESLVEKISETLTLFILSLLSPYIRPIIDAASKSLKAGSTTVIQASANAQFEPWNDPYCTDPTHSMLAKDHFSNKLNGVAGRVATTILQYVTPRLLYAWENPGVNVDDVMADISRVFHHPALRDETCELHRNMFDTVRKWVDEQPDRHNLNQILSSASVKAGRNHELKDGAKGLERNCCNLGGHGKTSDSIWSEIKRRDLDALEGSDLGYNSSYMARSSSAENGQSFDPRTSYNEIAPGRTERLQSYSSDISVPNNDYYYPEQQRPEYSSPQQNSTQYYPYQNNSSYAPWQQTSHQSFLQTTPQYQQQQMPYQNYPPPQQWGTATEPAPSPYPSQYRQQVPYPYQGGFPGSQFGYPGAGRQ